jgi:hypothetical protein
MKTKDLSKLPEGAILLVVKNSNGTFSPLGINPDQGRIITATGGVLSVRQWSAKPYRSPQEVITEIPAGIVGVQRLALRRERRVINHYAEEQDKPIATAMYYDYTAEVDGHPVPLEILAENDGLTVDDFKAWFAPVFAEADKKYPQFAGLASAVTIDFAIIHFTKRRY